ncbi:MAG: hypothetical protein ACYC6M_08315 [Terriglobales bacterium]
MTAAMAVPIALCVLLAVGVGYWVFSAPYENFQEPAGDALRRALRDKKQSIYDNLKDLHFEYLAGKLSEEDYQSSRRMLEGEAAVVVAELELASTQS